MQKILFVCTGNICRSPTAEAVFRYVVQQQKLQNAFTWDSAGTHGYHVGEAPDPRTIRTAERAGIMMADLQARKVNASDFSEFDLIFAMDDGHLRNLQKLAPANMQHKLQLYLPYAGYARLQEVPDPYYGEQRGFDDVLSMVQEATATLIHRLTATR